MCVSSSRPCLEGGRACWSRSGKPDARPGTDASSRAIFTNQWVAVPEQELLRLSKPGSPRSAGLEGSRRLSGPRWEPSTHCCHPGRNSGAVRRAWGFSAHTQTSTNSKSAFFFFFLLAGRLPHQNPQKNPLNNLAQRSLNR